MRRYPLYIFDLDGTIVRGPEPIPHAPETLAELRRQGATIRFVTNNSALTADEQALRLIGAGFEARSSEVMTSAMAAAKFCQSQNIQSVFVVGEAGLREAISEAEICLTGIQQAVVAGICRSISYEIIDEAMQWIKGGALFIATNTDRTYPLPGGREQPGAGAIVAAIRECTGFDPIVIGKPNAMMIEMILHETGINAADACVVGDRYETDIVCAKNAGCDGFLVLTGIAQETREGVTTIQDLRELIQ